MNPMTFRTQLFGLLRRRFIMSWHGFVLLVGLVILAPFCARAQAGNGWSPPQNLFETRGRASLAKVATGPAGDVHVIWEFGPEGEDSGPGQAIFYTHKVANGWSAPVDILISPPGSVTRTPEMVIDRYGRIHIVWSGGNALYYSQSNATEAGSARGWTQPFPLVQGVSALEPGIATDGNQRMYVVWTQGYNGLVLARSDDGGNTWLEPTTIFPAAAGNELARWGRVAVDGRGRVHVTLTYTRNAPDLSQGRRDPNMLFYLRSDDFGATWSEPLPVADEPNFGELTVTTFGDDIVHLVWNGRAGRHGRYHRWSSDGGQTWSDVDEVISPQHPLGGGGLTGFPAISVDSTGVLHMVSTSGTSSNYYLRWQQGSWTPPVIISDGVDGSGVTGINSTLEAPSLAISAGNLLHVVFHDGFERIWYVGSEIDAPSQEIAPLPTLLVNPTPTATPTSAQAPRPTAQPKPLAEFHTPQTAPAQRSVLTPLMVSALLAVLVVGGTLLVSRLDRR